MSVSIDKVLINNYLENIICNLHFFDINLFYKTQYDYIQNYE